MVDNFDASRVIAVGFLLWSLTTAATGLVRGFTMLLAMRLMLGVSESVMIPACSKIVGFHLPEHHRGFANGVLQGAWSSGPAVGTLGAGLLMAKHGWRLVFIGIGLIRLTWLPAWIKWMARGAATAALSPTIAEPHLNACTQGGAGLHSRSLAFASCSSTNCGATASRSRFFQ